MTEPFHLRTTIRKRKLKWIADVMRIESIDIIKTLTFHTNTNIKLGRKPWKDR